MNAIFKHAARLTVVVSTFGVVGAGCLTRPVATSGPTTKTNFTSVVRNQKIDKIDMLFDIDNSASMGDKQQYLIAAIPDLISRLVNPNCLDTMGNVIGPSNNGQCATGAAEFQPVNDMHLGIVTSALGARLSEPSPTGVCDPTVAATAPMGPFININAHNDDQGHLIARSLTINGTTAVEGSVAAAVVAAYTPAPGGFLYWFPGMGAAAGGPTPETMTGTAADIATVGTTGTANTLIGDFSSMVAGAGIFGCGIESQLESWYRFLIQPDPYGSLTLATVGTNQVGQWSQVDATILQERHDFLRPDSLVAIIDLTDENDSEIDVRSLGGEGYLFMRTEFEPPRGTQVCLTNPGDPGCQSCSLPANANDPNCKSTASGGPGPYVATNDWGYDMNLRHVHMKYKYGVDPQYPIQRYVNGLTSAAVPNRTGEYTCPANTPNCPVGTATGNYVVGNNNCVNPLFAASLPDGTDLNSNTLCSLSPGQRTPDLVFYAIIGGVPNQLLHFVPNNAAASTLTDADWVRILGKDPLNYNYDGIDPHMIEDRFDRTLGLAQGGAGAYVDPLGKPLTTDTTLTNALSASTTAPMTPDPVNGREWVTDQEMTPNTHVLRVDRQYACIFPLPMGQQRDCTQPQNFNSCDCPSMAGGLTPAQLPPVCNPTTQTTQIAAKAYPTTRELLVAKLMGSQGIASSLCPIHTVDMMQGNDPLYGYRPAVAVIIDRLKNALTNQCLPQKLTPLSDGSVPCLILVTLPAPMPADPAHSCLNPNCDPTKGLSVPDPTVLSTFCANQEAAFIASGGSTSGLQDPKVQSVCQLTELVNAQGAAGTPGIKYNTGDFQNGSCANAADPGWCYVEGANAAKGCSQAIIFQSTSPPAGSTSSLQCIEATGTDGG
ncbi:MAG: hypothetical protein ABSC94_26180 [Polyangiaceae bacterium]|jgi:hypothetical protein